MAKNTYSEREQAQNLAAIQFQASLRPLKNRLQSRYPSIKSSHLTEAIAAGLGFESNAALRAKLEGPNNWQLPLVTFSVTGFRDRLVSFDYPLHSDLQLGNPAAAPKPSPQHLERLRRLKELENSSNRQSDLIYELRNRCALEFAQAFGLGHLEDRDDKRIVKRWTIGVDHAACMPGWGGKFNNSHGGLVSFPGDDHTVQFCQSLPLANGKLVEYQSARVSQPYVGVDGQPREAMAAGLLAGRIGWHRSVHPDWAWYGIGQSTLVLYQRTTPYEVMLRAWEHSFQRWLFENRPMLNKSSGATRRKVLADILDCQHCPLDLVDYEDCRERYLKEFAYDVYDERDGNMAKVFDRLMTDWQESRGLSNAQDSEK